MKKLIAAALITASFTANAYEWEINSRGDAQFDTWGEAAVAFCNDLDVPVLLLSKSGAFFGNGGRPHYAHFDNGALVKAYGMTQDNMVQIFMVGEHAKLLTNMKAANKVTFELKSFSGSTERVSFDLKGSSKVLNQVLEKCI